MAIWAFFRESSSRGLVRQVIDEAWPALAYAPHKGRHGNGSGFDVDLQGVGPL